MRGNHPNMGGCPLCIISGGDIFNSTLHGETMKIAIYDKKVVLLDDERKEVDTFSSWVEVNDFISRLREAAQEEFGNDWSDPKYDV
jgi:hypothetical protein